MCPFLSSIFFCFCLMFLLTSNSLAPLASLEWQVKKESCFIGAKQIVTDIHTQMELKIKIRRYLISKTQLYFHIKITYKTKKVVK